VIPLRLDAASEATAPFVARLRSAPSVDAGPFDAVRVACHAGEAAYVSASGLFTVATDDQDLDGDIVLVEPRGGIATRIIRAASPHNSLLITERCDQLCVMCSQPPKKTHVDRFDIFRRACLLAPKGHVIGVSGGEPTLYKQQLFDLVEHVLSERPDLGFHVLSNGQHFEQDDIRRLRQVLYRNVSWGIPLYAADPARHDEIVGKQGAFARLEQSLHVLLRAGAGIELRTVVMRSTVGGLEELARHIVARLSFIASWSIMQLENTGFAKRRWGLLYFNHARDFGPISAALDVANVHDVRARLFNFPLCTVPPNYRHLAPPSISDWKRKYAAACSACSAVERCAGFFEWHPEDELMEKVTPL
jgi:His-Xaa-Ser system radical SAM maturase HxsC